MVPVAVPRVITAVPPLTGLNTTKKVSAGSDIESAQIVMPGLMVAVWFACTVTVPPATPTNPPSSNPTHHPPPTPPPLPPDPPTAPPPPPPAPVTPHQQAVASGHGA